MVASSLVLLGCQGNVSDVVGEGRDFDESGGAGGADNILAGRGGVAATGGAGRTGEGGVGGTVAGSSGQGGRGQAGNIAGNGGQGGNVAGSGGQGGNVAGSGQGGDTPMAGAGGTSGGGGVVAPPAGTVPMFVAVGRGGRRVTSCDRGRTWIADQMVAPESQDNEHQPYTPKGMTYGDGTFIFLTGWGTASTTWTSSNGVTWTQKKHDTGFGGIGFDKGTFVAIGGNYVALSVDKGVTWTRSSAPKSPLNRENAAFDGIWAGGSDGQVVTMRTGGTSWVPLSGCRGRRHGGIGMDGGYAAGLGFMVSVGDDGDTCGINIATGAPLAAGKISAVIRGKPSFVGDAIWIASGDKLHTTTDGVGWVSRTLPTGVRFDLVARSASGTFAAASGSGDSFYFSDDGERWTKATGPSGNGLNFLLAGAGSPSPQCPMP